MSEVLQLWNYAELIPRQVHKINHDFEKATLPLLVRLQFLLLFCYVLFILSQIAKKFPNSYISDFRNVGEGGVDAGVGGACLYTYKHIYIYKYKYKYLHTYIYRWRHACTYYIMSDLPHG